MRVEVTREDVARGRRCDSTGCPVAAAIRRATAGATVTVNVEQALTDGRAVGLPFDVGEAVARFDREGVMEPMSFELPLEGAGS